MLEELFQKLFPTSRSQPTGPVEFIVVGLGNPGRDYENTRHNTGYLALDRLAEQYGVKVTRIQFKSLCGECVIAGKKVLLLKPTTFMNLSGQAVTEAMAFYKIPVEQMIVVCDDVALEQGQIRVRRKGSDGGQKGLRNIIYLTGADTFPRVRIGIGAKAHPDMNLVDWVIGRFTKEEAERLNPAIDASVEAIKLIVAGEIAEAMNRFNRKPPSRDAEETP